MNEILLSLLVLGGLGAVFGLLLAFASKKFHVEVDPRQAAVREALAGANCGGCGFPGCDGYAKAVAEGTAPPNKCVAGGAETAKKVAEIMGVDAGSDERKIAFVHCSGTDECAEKRFNYSGPQDCRAAMLFGGKSNKTCTFACIGLGNCTKVCKFDAIHVVDGVAKVDRYNCVGCGACAEACPKSIIELLPASQRVAVGCRNKDKGAPVIRMCHVGCIGCGNCQRECPADAITVKDFLAGIDLTKCVGCGHCVNTCPRKIINWFEY